MKAVQYEKYGPPDVLQLKEIARPEPKEDEVLIRVQAASVNAMEWHLVSADMVLVRLMGVGLRKPKDPRLGTDVAGQVVAVGQNVRQFQPGDEVFGFGKGVYAEYACAKERLLALKPANLSFEQAAAVPIAAITALQGLRDVGQIQTHPKVVIQGASGGVGTFAVQIARSFGAEVTAVCSARNLELVRSLGADRVIDYRKEDFTRGGQRYDLILAVNGYHPIPDYQRALNPGGICAVAGGTPGQIVSGMFLGAMYSKIGGKKVASVNAKSNQQDLLVLKELLETGKIEPVIDACYPLEKAVDAFRYFSEVHPRGKVVIKVA